MGLQKGKFRLKLETPVGLFLVGSIRESLEKAMNSGLNLGDGPRGLLSKTVVLNKA